MNQRDLNPNKRYRYARYARTSNSNQGPRSLDRQLAAIDEMIAREGRTWKCVATYCDVGQSGRDLKNDSGFQQLIRDIGAGLIIVDLIVVDTSDRFGRAAELEGLRRLLTSGQVVMIVIADRD